MNQTLVVVKSTLKSFLTVLEMNCKLNPHVRNACVSPAELLAKVHGHFWDWNKSQAPAGHADHAEALLKWENECLRVYVVEEFGPAGCARVGGYVVLQGELLAFHCTRKGRGEWMLHHAQIDGAYHCDTFNCGPMPKLLQSNGWHMNGTEPNSKGPGHPEILYYVRKNR